LPSAPRFENCQVKLQVGSLLKNQKTGELGLVTSPVRYYGLGEVKYIWVLWSSCEAPQRLDLSVIKNNWIEIVNESR